MPALPQAEANLLVCLFEQFPHFWTCPEEYEKTWAKVMYKKRFN